MTDTVPISAVTEQEELPVNKKSYFPMRIIMAVCLVSFLCVLCSFSFAETHSGTWGDLTWNLSEEGVLTVSGNGPINDFPEPPAEEPVEESMEEPSAEEPPAEEPSGEAWHAYSAQIKSIVIGNGITSVGKRAFSTTDATSITIPDTVTMLDQQAFADNVCLEEIVIPNSVTKIGASAFEMCGLKSIVIPNGITTIEGYTFWRCSDLSTVVLPDSVTSIGDGAFMECEGSGIQLPKKLVSIGKDALSWCCFKTISIPESVTEIGEGAFLGCEYLETITLPASINKIEASTFNFCTQMSSITFTKNVGTIGADAFSECQALKDVYYSGTKEDAEKIAIDIGNENLQGATWHYSGEEAWTIKFDANGGTGTMNDVTVKKGDKYTLPSCGFTAPSGKEFDKWDKGTPETAIEITADTVITALWKDQGPPPPASITLSKNKVIFEGVDRQIITVTFSDPEDSIASVTSEEPAVAKVRFSGNKFTVSSSKKAGKTSVTVTTVKGATATLQVKVKENWALNARKITLKKGKTFKIKLLAVPSTVKMKAFKSDKPQIATVDSKGKVKAIKKGKATITVTLSNRKTLKLRVKVK